MRIRSRFQDLSITCRGRIEWIGSVYILMKVQCHLRTRSPKHIFENKYISQEISDTLKGQFTFKYLHIFTFYISVCKAITTPASLLSSTEKLGEYSLYVYLHFTYLYILLHIFYKLHFTYLYIYIYIRIWLQVMLVDSN